MLPAAWDEQLRSTLHLAARYFPLPVHFEGAPLPYEDFLAGAAHIELWEGCRIGIFHDGRSEEHTSELQSLMRISYAVFCLKKTNQQSKIYQYHAKQSITSIYRLSKRTITVS